MLRRCCVFMNQGPPYNLSHPTYILFYFFQQCFFYMHRAKGRHATAFVYWWTPGIFTWEERTPPVHLHTLLVVRSHEVLTGSPAIQTAGQSTLCQCLA